MKKFTLDEMLAGLYKPAMDLLVEQIKTSANAIAVNATRHYALSGDVDALTDKIIATAARRARS